MNGTEHHVAHTLSLRGRGGWEGKGLRGDTPSIYGADQSALSQMAPFCSGPHLERPYFVILGGASLLFESRF